MFQAEVTQYLRPDGRTRKTTTELPDELLPLYDEMMSAECRFEAEVLRDGEVFLTVSLEEEDLDSVLVMNGPDVQNGLIAMLRRKRWEKES